MTRRRYPMTIAAALAELRTKPVIDLWPTAAVLLDISRDGVYRAANNGEIELLEIGRLKKAVSSALRKRLGLQAAERQATSGLMETAQTG
jgi:hypothetical protein